MDSFATRHESRLLEQSQHAPALVCRFVTSTLDTWGVGATFADVPLVTSELVTNVVQHASSAVDVTLDLTPARLRLEVSDGSAIPPVLGHLDDAHDGGWGLHIVSALASRWGLESRANGKTVWCEVSLPSGAESYPAA